DTVRDGWAQIFEISVDETEDAAPKMVGRLRSVLDAEVSPDGDRAAVVTASGVFLIAGRKLRRVAREQSGGTLWVSSDGTRVLFASPKVVTLLTGSETRTLKASGQRFKSARFLNGGPEVLVAGEHSALRWNSLDDDQRETVVTGGDAEEILAADMIGHDVVVWAQHPTVRYSAQ